jgi:hypothetical protein
VAVGGRVLRTTAEHLFWVRGRGWTAARQLRVGDELRSHDGRWLAVEGVRDTGREEVVYNCRVAEYHTYFVGCDEWGFSLWAHNQYHARQGYIIFGELDELGRPTGVRATIISEMLGTGSQAAQRIRPPGFGGKAAGHANQVAAAVRSGQIVDYWVIPVYHGNNPIPIGVTLRARGSGGFNLDVTILNRGR